MFCKLIEIEAPFSFICNEGLFVGGWGGVGGYDQLCCPVSPKLLLGLNLGLGCDKTQSIGWKETLIWWKKLIHGIKNNSSIEGNYMKLDICYQNNHQLEGNKIHQL